VARVRNNAVLKRLALPAIDAVVWEALNNGPPGDGEPRTWVRESSYRAGSWSRSRRVVQVVVERPGELIPRCFWLLTSMPADGRVAERVLRTPARFTVSGRRITMTTGGACGHWHMLADGLAALHGPPG